MIVDVYHDTVCPWCRIGKRHLDRALASWIAAGKPAPEVRWHPFFLDADVPDEGLPFREYFMERKGLADPEPMFRRVCQVGAAVDLDFRFDKVAKATNTLRSHRLIALAPDALRPAVVDAIHRAYFEEGRDIGDVETLADLAPEAGLDRDETAAALHSDAARDAVLADAAASRRVAMHGVPVFAFDGAVAVSGAQPAEVLLEAMQEAEAAHRGAVAPTT